MRRCLLVRRAVGSLRLRCRPSRSMVFEPVLSFAMAGAEGAEVVHHRLIDQDIAVGKEENALLAPGLPQTPDDLEGGVGLAGAGGHDEQDAVLALGDGLDGFVDGDALVVARLLAAAVVVVILKNDPLLIRAESFPVTVPATRALPGMGKSSSESAVSMMSLWPVRSWNRKPSPFEEKTKGMSRVPA